MNAKPIQSTGTKIVATIGPASQSETVISDFIDAGLSVARINFSHGSLQDHAKTVEIVRRVASEKGAAIGILGDLSGPKIRLTDIAAESIHVSPGDYVTLAPDTGESTIDRLRINQPEIIADIKIGDPLLIDDGEISIRATRQTADGLVCKVEIGGTLKSRKGINLPDTDLHIDSITEKDWGDLRWAIEQNLDFIALSFVRKLDEVQRLQTRIREWGGDQPVFAKIETRRAMDHLEEIVRAADGIMVARGDLGVELDVATVPRIQKQLIDLCRIHAKPVITATQMLQSMVDSPTPTRAEVSDVANAICDGTDAVMLSAETATGNYPTRAVAMMHRIARETEAYDQDFQPTRVNKDEPNCTVSSAVARSATQVADEVDAAGLVVMTIAGDLARLVSKFRLDRPVLALTETEQCRRRMALMYGIRPVFVEKKESDLNAYETVERVVLQQTDAKAGDLFVIATSPSVTGTVNTGSITIRRID